MGNLRASAVSKTPTRAMLSANNILPSLQFLLNQNELQKVFLFIVLFYSIPLFINDRKYRVLLSGYMHVCFCSPYDIFKLW
jgi:hypothetical protein